MGVGRIDEKFRFGFGGICRLGGFGFGLSEHQQCDKGQWQPAEL